MFNGFYRHKRVLITGHTGFKGAWLSLWLNRLGARVIGYALKPPTNPSLFKVCALGDKTVSISGDVRDINKLGKVFKRYRPEIVFHLAAQSLVRRSYHAPAYTYSTNVMGTVNLLESCRNIESVQAVINVTSDKCYKNYEDKQKFYAEADPLGGEDPYSSSKGCAELITAAYIKSFFNPNDYRRKHRIALASVRAGNVIGGGDWAQDRFVPDCIKAFKDKKPVLVRYPDAIRPWQYVLEPLYGYMLLAQRLYQNGPKFSGAWNFGPRGSSDKPVRWLVDKMAALWGGGAAFWTIDAAQKPQEALYLRLNWAKAKSKLKWQCVYGLKTTLEKTVEWYKAYYQSQDMLKISLAQIHDFETMIKQRKTV